MEDYKYKFLNLFKELVDAVRSAATSVTVISEAPTYNTPQQYDMGNNDTLHIAAGTVASLTLFIEDGSVDVLIGGSGTPITYSSQGVYSWNADELLNLSFDFTFSASGIGKIITMA